jgi:uncharacterized protein (TIGR02646 family)
MLQLIDRELTQAEQNILIDLQSKVNVVPSFIKKANKARTLWKTKGNVAGRRTFEKIKVILEEMCVGVKACNYCEGNEANDIEHIYPKSFFPEYAFIWSNYLLACKQCNSAYKLDLCFVLDQTGNVYATTRGSEPPHKALAFINPRLENPDNFFWLNMKIWKFEIHDGLSLENHNKAKKTLEILALNERDYLIAGRSAAAQEYFDKMDRLSRIIQATSIQELKVILTPYQSIIDDTLPLGTIKNDLKESVRQHLKKLLHPSVWKAIKTIESSTDPRWVNIFATIPEALTW